MAPPDRERLVDEIAKLSRTLGALERQLGTVVGTPTTTPSADEAPTMVETPISRSDEPPPTVVHARRGASASRGLPSRTSEAAPRAPADAGFDERYSSGEILGEGGMGEVRLCMDRRIGRAVAMKVMRPGPARDPKLRARFLFEAKVQGQLEHPSIVPVYDIGTRPDGAVYFTMKRVHGRTLHEILKALAAGDEVATAQYTRRRLLTAFQAACLAVEYAHQHGVIHRDLKPANLMLGSLGELSILDWGLAKVTPTRRAFKTTPEADAALQDARASEETAVGEVLGTPGYMSPEQAAGGTHVDGRSDVFALGAMLFEILTRKHLVPGKASAEISRATMLGGYDARAAELYPDLDIPPELEQACVLATQVDASRRMATAVQLHDAIERYLEGDRDGERRRAQADAHARAAIAATTALAEASDPDAARAARALAVKEVTRALVLDPGNGGAMRTMMLLATDTAAPATPEAAAVAARIELASRRKVATRGMLAYACCAAFLGVVALNGVKSWLALGGSAAFFLAAAALAFFTARRASAAEGVVAPVLILALSSCGVAVAAGLFGPFIYVPSLCVANVIVFSAGVDRRARLPGIACGVVAALAPLVLEELGVGPRSWAILGDHIEIFSRAIQFPPLGTKVVLVLETLGTLVLPALIVGAERDARARAERRLAIHAHQLAEFVPSEVHATTQATAQPQRRG